MTKDVKIGLAIGLLLLVVLFVWLAAKGSNPADSKTSADSGKGADATKAGVADARGSGPAKTSSDAGNYYSSPSAKPYSSDAGKSASAVVTEAPKTEDENVAKFDMGSESEGGTPAWGGDSRDLAAGKAETKGTEPPTYIAKSDAGARKTGPIDADAQRFLDEYTRQYPSPDTTRGRDTGAGTGRTTYGADPGPVAKTGGTSHVVKQGETLSEISQQHYGTRGAWREIAKANKIDDPGRIRPGMVLTIPERSAPAAAADSSTFVAKTSGDAKTHVVKPGETAGQISSQYYGTSKYWKNILEANGIDDPTRLAAGTTIIIPELKETVTPTGSRTAPPTIGANQHVVKPGETLYEISRKYFGSERYVKDIMKANGIEDPTRLQAGQVLTIPERSADDRPRRLDRSPESEDPTLRPGERRYTVKANETLAEIASRELGSWRRHADIEKRNGIADPTRLRAGQVIILPAAESSHFLSTTTVD